MKKNKILVFGANGLVGKSVVKTLSNSSKVESVDSSTRKDTDLKNIDEIKNILNIKKPDYIINCAAKVGGIHANNTFRAEFLLENLKINNNARMVISRSKDRDELLLKVESKLTDINDIDGIQKSISEEIKNVLNLRGETKIVPVNSLPNDGKVIDDIRDFGD